MGANASEPSNVMVDKSDMEDLFAVMADKLGPSFRSGLSAADKAKLDAIRRRRDARRESAPLKP